MKEVTDGDSGLTSPLAAVLKSGRWGLATDFDGTISALVSSPGEARVDEVCRQYLQVLAGQLPLLAVVSGRPVAEVRRLVGVDGLVYLGNHGLERWVGEGVQLWPAAVPYRAQVAAALAELGERLGGAAGLRWEDKGVTASVHYRQAPDPDRARQDILAALEKTSAAAGLRVTEGKMVLELRPPVEVHKGRALVELIEEYGLRGAAYLGDDRTDLDAFRALHDWRAAGRGSACSIAVAGPETPPEVTGGADVVLPGISAVRRLLEWLCQSALG